MTNRLKQSKWNPVSAPSPLSPARLSGPALRVGTQSGGSALDRKTQSEMSARFGHDFSQVRIHTDARAEESAETMGANAYTLGQDIVFGGGQWTPGSPNTERLLAHELTHVVQQARSGPGDPSRTSSRADASEREAETLGPQVMAGRPVQVQAAPRAAVARDEEDGGGFFSHLASGAGSLASTVASGTEDLVKSEVKGVETVAGAAYDGYEKTTDFSVLKNGLNSGADWVEKKTAEGDQKMVDDSKGHWYEGLAKADAWVNDETTQATGGLVKGVGDLGFGLANGVAHPLDAAAGMEGIAEHNMIVPGLGSTLKAGHGAYDLLSGKKDGEYGSSWGDLADHVLNPMTQMNDDQKFDEDMATNIIAPDKNKDGTTDWSAWKNKPTEAAMRALTNIAPIALGLGEAAAGDGAAEVSNAAKPVEPASPISPKATTIEMPAVNPAEPPSPISPKATTVEVPVKPGSIGDPNVDPFGNTDVNPFGKTDVNPFGKTDPSIPAQPPIPGDPAALPGGKTIVDPDFNKGAVPGMPWWDPAPPAEANWGKQLEWGFRQYEPGGLWPGGDPLPTPPRAPEVPLPDKPSISKNPVMQMPAVDPALIGGPQPPGWQAGPYNPYAMNASDAVEL